MGMPAAAVWLVWPIIAGAGPQQGLAPEKPLVRFEFEESHMASPFKIVLYSTSPATARRASRAAFDRIAELNSILSDYDPESELSRLSQSAGKQPVPVSADLFDVLDRSRTMYERSEGAFDVTIAPVGRLWRRARRERKLPDPLKLAEARSLVGSDRMILDRAARTVWLKTPGMRLDVGGIAKGYAAQAALDVLKKAGVNRAARRRCGRYRRRRGAARYGGMDDRDRAARAGQAGRGASPPALAKWCGLDGGRCGAVRDHRWAPLLAHHQSQDRASGGRPRERDRRRPGRRDGRCTRDHGVYSWPGARAETRRRNPRCRRNLRSLHARRDQNVQIVAFQTDPEEDGPVIEESRVRGGYARAIVPARVLEFSAAEDRHQAVLVLSTLLGSWLGMQAAHESGHVLGAVLTGGEVATVVLYPLTISHTELIDNPHPLIVVWAGPLVGVLLPLVLWGVLAVTGTSGAFIARGSSPGFWSDREWGLHRGRLVSRHGGLRRDASARVECLGFEAVRCGGRTAWLLALERHRSKLRNGASPREGEPSAGIRQPGDLLAPRAAGIDRGRCMIPAR